MQQKTLLYKVVTYLNSLDRSLPVLIRIDWETLTITATQTTNKITYLESLFVLLDKPKTTKVQWIIMTPNLFENLRINLLKCLNQEGIVYSEKGEVTFQYLTEVINSNGFVYSYYKTRVKLITSPFWMNFVRLTNGSISKLFNKLNS